jgi:hypothetical protein
MAHQQSKIQRERFWVGITLGLVWLACVLYSCKSSESSDRTGGSTQKLPSSAPRREPLSSAGHSVPPSVAPAALLPEDQERIESWKTWLSHGRALAKASGDPRAQKIMDFLAEHTPVGRPECANGAVGFLPVWFPGERGRVDIRQVAIPFVSADEKRASPSHREIFRVDPRGGVAASFNPDDRILVLRPHRLSPVVAGAMILHEGDHALTLLERPYDWKDRRAFCEAERDTHEFQNRIVERAQGDAYRAALRAESDRIRGKVVFDAVESTWTSERPVAPTAEADVAFGGPAFSEMDRMARASALWMHAVFLEIERTHPQDAALMKARFYCSNLAQDEAEGIVPTPAK